MSRAYIVPPPSPHAKHTRGDPDEDYEIYQLGNGKAGRTLDEHGPAALRGCRRGPKIMSANQNDFSTTYKNALDRAHGFTRGAEAFDQLARAYTFALGHTAPVMIGYAGGQRPFTQQACDELLALLDKDGFTLVSREFSPPSRTCVLFDQTVWRAPHGAVALVQARSGRVDQGDNITVLSTDVEMIERYTAWWESGKVQESPVAKISGVFSGQNGIEIREFSTPIGWPLERGNYTKDVLSFYDTLCTELISPTPSGRLAILDGKPGGGKTYLLRGLVQDLSDRAHFIYLPASMVASLDGPQMLSLLNEEQRYSYRDEGADAPKPKIFVVEDADDCLVSRAADNMSSIRNLLNFCDGFLGMMLDVRIVATTNSGHIGRTDKVDAALLRPGRLIARSTVPPLSVEDLRAWFERHALTPEKLNDGMTLAEAYAKAREMGWKPE